MMRFVMAAVLLTLPLPVADAGYKPGCGNHCESTYASCMSHAKNSQARKSCKTNHKNCNAVCNR
jgi:hypothetical protein